MSTVTAIAIGMLAVAAASNIARAIRPGSVIDRAVALDGVVSVLICGLGVGGGHGEMIDIALVGGLLGFLTLATVARYVGRRGA